MRLFELPNPLAVRVHTESGWHDMEKTGADTWGYLSGSEKAEMVMEANGTEAVIRIPATETPLFSFQLRWKAAFEPNVKLLGDDWERASGDLEWRGLVPDRTMPWYFIADEGATKTGLGVKTGPNALCRFYADASGVSLYVDVACGSQGVLLGKRDLEACTVVLDSDDSLDAFHFGRRFLKKLAVGAILPKQPIYGGNDWYYTYGKNTAAAMTEFSDFISQLSPNPDNRPYMVLDGSWQKHRRLGGPDGAPWVGNENFPDMPGLAQAMRDKGTRPGIWFRPLLSAEPVKESWVRKTTYEGYVLDPSNPEVLEFVANTVKTFNAWGYELIKHDFITYDMAGIWSYAMHGWMHRDKDPYMDPTKTTAEITKDVYRAIHEARNGGLIIGCNTVGHLGVGLFEIQRIGCDTSGLIWEKTRHIGVNSLAMRAIQHNIFYAADGDCVGITKNIDWSLNRQWLRLLGYSGTPLFVSVSPSLPDEAMKREIRAAMDAASREMPLGIPLDWQYNSEPAHWILNGKEEYFDWYAPFNAHLDLWWRD